MSRASSSTSRVWPITLDRADFCRRRAILGRPPTEWVHIVIGGATIPLSGLAVEEALLENVLSPDEIASIAGPPVALPASATQTANGSAKSYALPVSPCR